MPKHGRVVITRFSRRQRVPLGAAQRERRKIALRMVFYAICCVSMPAPRYVAYFLKFAPSSAPSISLQTRRALERPMAIACFVERAPCLPSRTWCISSRTNSPACVEGAYRHAYPGERVRLFVSQACSTLLSDLCSSRRRDKFGSQASLYSLPVHIGEERVDVLWSVGWRVIQNECMLPNIHHENRNESRNIANLMQGDPMVRDPAGVRVLIADCPTDASHFSDPCKVELSRFRSFQSRLQPHA